MLTAQAYEPDEPEGPSRSAYMSKNDLKWILIILAVLAVIFIPVYQQMKRQANQARCAQNVNAMFTAVTLYMESNDQRFPPIFDQLPNGSPSLHNGKPFTWASLVQPLMTARANMRCPSATPDEVAHVVHSEKPGESIELTYGMYLPLSGAYSAVLENPADTVLLAETSNHGARNTFNPKPFLDLEGRTIPVDGFAIGFDNSNFEPDGVTRSVTRLAFYNTSEGDFRSEEVIARHNEFIHVLYANGTLGSLSPNEAYVRHLRPYLTGIWRNR